MKKIVILTILGMYSSLNAEGLIQKAYDSGLKAIPNERSELLKIIDNKDNKITKEKVSLGKKLYFDPRLSKSGLISCNTCHNLSEGGDDGLPAAVGHKWRVNPHHLNSPTVLNSVFYDKQFWDGRSPDLEDQAKGPTLAQPEMAATKEHIEKVVNSIPEYVTLFKESYGNDINISFNKITSTIATFERILVTTSRYDEFLLGNEKSLNKEEQIGLNLFIDKGCVSCHNGYALGGSMQPFGIVRKFKNMDIGDFKGDKNKMVRTPTLRNITKTSPYFHNGTIFSLKESIKEMGEIQLGITLKDNEIVSIEKFLKSLDAKEFKMELPQLPSSTLNTPIPNIE